MQSLLAEYLKEHPDALERMHFVMLHPFRDDDDDEMSRSAREIHHVAKRMKFFQDYVARNPYDSTILINNPTPRSKLYLDFVHYVAALLGPIGSYEIFD